MRYELRIDGAVAGVFQSAEEALERVRAALAGNADHEAEIIDRTTGKAYEPAASVAARDALADQIGY